MSEFEVPNGVRSVTPSISGKMIWLYGEPKIGKTTFACQIGEVWVVASEKGQDFVSVRQPTFVSNWKQFRSFVEWLYKTKPTHFGDGKPIEWIVLDIVDTLFRHCNTEVCKALSVEDPGELAHGKGWSRLRNEFHTVMNALRSLPYGLICISHEARKETVIRNVKSTRIQPSVGASGYDWLLGGSDLILRAYSVDVAVKDDKGKVTGAFASKRMMQLHPNAGMVAGGRMSQFLPPSAPFSAKDLLTILSKADASVSTTVDEVSLPVPTAAVEPLEAGESQQQKEA